MKETEMQGRWREFEAKACQRSCTGQIGGNNGPSLDSVVAEFAREELLSAAKEMREQKWDCTCTMCRDSRKAVAEWLERRAGK